MIESKPWRKMNEIILTIIQYVVAPVVVALITYFLGKNQGVKKQQQKPKEPVNNNMVLTDRKRFAIDIDLTEHYLFDVVGEFVDSIRTDYRAGYNDSDVDRAIVIILENFINIISDIYKDESNYWQSIFTGCKKDNSCVQCVISPEQFQKRQLDIFDDFIELFTTFTDHYDFSREESIIIKKILVSLRSFDTLLTSTKKEIKNICHKDSVCLKKKMFKIMDKISDFIGTVDNNLDDTISVIKRQFPEPSSKWFKTRPHLVSVVDMKTRKLLKSAEKTDVDSFIQGIADSFEMQEQKIRGS